MQNSPFIFTLAVFILISCNKQQNISASQASEFTRRANQQIADYLDLDNQQDFENASRGLIAKAPDIPVTESKSGAVIWHPSQYDFIEGEAPASVNPSLWRQAKLNQIRGLFKVTDGIYQLRGFDLANMTLIEGETGWIVIDPLTAIETASHAMSFARQHLGEKPISAIVFSHSHVDHFGGALGIVNNEEVKANKIPVIAPEGFVHEATSENIVAGAAMTRRAMFMYGMRLPRNATGHVDTGLGIQPMIGNTSMLLPTIIVDQPIQLISVDGVDMVFYNMPNSEAPAEMVMQLPQKKALFGAEIVSSTQHNVYTLRGAKVRDALQWSDYINQLTSTTFDIYLGSHHWPIWGSEAIHQFLSNQRDLYKYIHDQTLRLANNGLTPQEIADTIQLPDALAKPFYNRNYYGTVKHNSKAVYQHYFGWYDANPANLDPLPQEQSSLYYIKMMGGAEKVLQQANDYYNRGEYRWVAELLNHLVFTDPGNKAGKKLLADTYQQLAYQAESGPWRDVYLSAALELIQGAPAEGVNIQRSALLLTHIPLIQFFKSLSVRLNPAKAEGVTLTAVFNFTDLEESYVVQVKNSVMHYWQNGFDDSVENDVTLNITQQLFLEMLTGKTGPVKALLSDDLSIDGSKSRLAKFFTMLDNPNGNYNIVTP